MACCDLLDSCFFYNELMTDMPQTTEYLEGKYCRGSFRNCVIYRFSSVFGKHDVPKYLYPNDMFVSLSYDIPGMSESQRDMDLFTRVIFPDGSTGMVRSSDLGTLAHSLAIVAFQSPEGWTELRRKQDMGFKGPDRRMIRHY